MPRKPRKSDAPAVGINPRESLLEHRNFLARSLSRNDAELSALVKLNLSLKKAKEAILESCGEQVLLDIGVGKLKLINDELHQEQVKKPETPLNDNDDDEEEEEKKSVTDDEGEEEKEKEEKDDKEKEDKDEEKEKEDETKEEEEEEEETEEVYHLSPAQKDLCVDFLLRMKLRRKLCNRLARRLNRIAHAMDGEDVAPPPPPRYGDLSLNIDPEALKAKEAHWKRLQEAEERLELAKKNKKPEEIGSISLAVKKEDEPSKAEDAAVDDDDDDDPLLKEEPEDDTNDAEDDDKINADTTTSFPVKKEESLEDDLPSIGSSPMKEIPIPMTQFEQDEELLKTYDEAYEKVWDEETKSFKYTILDEIHLPDYATIRDGGVGALSRNMTEEEREAENQRWKQAILARVPRQPTFEELGMKNRVFCLEQRLKRCREEAEQEEEEAEADDSSNKKPKTEGKEGQDMDVDKDDKKEESKEGEDDGKAEGDKPTESPAKAATKETKTPEKKNMGAAEKKKEPSKEEVSEEDLEYKPMKPMSLAAVPSFYDQDSMRLKNIQGDMIGQTMLSSAKDRIAALVHSYNDALMKSVQCFTRRQQIQQQVALVVEQGRRELAKANSDYSLKVTLGKQKWLADKKEHDQKRLSTMPSRFGQLANGTSFIQSYMINNGANQISLMVGAALGDIVDLTVMQAEGKLTTNTKYPDFVPPPAPMLPPQFRNEQVKLKNDFDRYTNQFNQLEEQRRMKWRKYMQGRAEIEVKYGVSSRRVASTYTAMPCPQLQRATQQSIPPLEFATSSRAGYTPTNRPPPSSDPKYSAAKVKQRIANDGTVAPVSEPKKDKDGLYMRPSGRTRKGMQWDAIRGLWVPEN